MRSGRLANGVEAVADDAAGARTPSLDRAPYVCSAVAPDPSTMPAIKSFDSGVKLVIARKPKCRARVSDGCPEKTPGRSRVQPSGTLGIFVCPPSPSPPERGIRRRDESGAAHAAIGSHR